MFPYLVTDFFNDKTYGKVYIIGCTHPVEQGYSTDYENRKEVKGTHSFPIFHFFNA